MANYTEAWKLVVQSLLCCGDEKFQVIEKTQFPTTTPYETIDRTIEFFKRYEDQLEGIAIGFIWSDRC